MKKIFNGIIAGAILLGLSYSILASDVPEKVTVDHFKKKKAAVVMNHKEHGDVLKIKCETCHHKKKEGEKAKETKCADAACHAKVQEKDGVKYDAQSPKKDNPFHKNCLEDCHKKLPKELADKKPPTKCVGCHPKQAGEEEE